jgi:hypothetical protein
MEDMHSSVHTYLACCTDASKIDESTVKSLWPKFVESFYNDVEEEDAHIMLCAVKGLPIIMMSVHATDEHHLALLTGRDDEIPDAWIWTFYEDYKRYTMK